MKEENEIYCSFAISVRELRNHAKLVHDFISEKKLQTKVLNTFYDEDAEYTWYVVSEKTIPNDVFLLEFENIINSDTYYGSL